MITQRERAEHAAKTIRELQAKYERELAPMVVDLREVLGQSQNGPPDGESDGTISEAHWLELRMLLAKATGEAEPMF